LAVRIALVALIPQELPLITYFLPFQHACRFAIGRGRIWLDNVVCSSSSSSILSCSHNSIGVHNCNHNGDIALHCCEYDHA